MDEGYPAGFRPLFARAPREAAPPVAPPAITPSITPAIAEPEPEPLGLRVNERDALSEVALFRASLRELLESRLPELLRAIAHDVMARELLLAPADIRAIVESMLANCCDETPLEIRVAALDAARLPQSAWPVRVDPSLRSGEAAIEVRSGIFESRLETRLAHIVERLAP